MATEPAAVLEERDGPVAVVRINRPEKRNALNQAVLKGLAETFARLDEDPEVSAIVLTGAGDAAFSAGADMRERVDNLDAGQTAHSMEDYTVPARCRKPVIAAIHGFCYGGGAALALSCDLRLGAPTARFRFIGAAYGLVVSATQLAWLTGPAVAKDLLFTAREVEAEEAHRLGILNQVFPQELLLAEAIGMGKQIAANSSAAVGWIKAVVEAATTNVAGLEAEAAADAATRGTAEQLERFRQAARRVTGS